MKDASAAKTVFGEPITLKGKAIYFTSWKYVRPGDVRWTIQRNPGQPNEPPSRGVLVGPDGPEPARFDLVDGPLGVRLVAQEAAKSPLAPGQFAAQVYDGGKFKTWYPIPPCPQPETFSSKDRILPGHDYHVAYAESEDGFHWETPKQGLFEYAGSRDNNIVFRGDVNGSARGWHGGSVFIDPSSEEEHYKMIYLGIITDEEWDAFERKYPGEADPMARRKDVGGYRCVLGVFGAVSPDGIHWTSLPEPLMIQHSDTLNTCYYDLDCGQYVAYVRAWLTQEQAPGMADKFPDSWISVGRRSIGRAVSDDFRHFAKPELVIAPGAEMSPTYVWYTNAKTTLPGCPDQHVMFPWRWEEEQDGGDVYLFSSPDGWMWSQVPGGPVVRCGALGTPDGCYVGVGINLLEYPDGRWGIPYTGNPIPHKYPGRDTSLRKGLFPGVPGTQGIAFWPKGRLVALDCPDEGRFATVGIMPPGDRIRLNASIRPTGYIKVAVRLMGQGDVPGRGFEDADFLVGDDVAMPVTWKGESDLRHGGAPIVLRFQLRQAKLFGIEFW